MSLLDQARIDARAMSVGSFSQTATFESAGGVIVTIQALGNKIGRKISEGGVIVNSKNASIVPHEDELTSRGFPVRNSDGEVSMLGTKVTTKDVTGIDRIYYVQENIPDETIGLITLLLGDFEND